MKQELVLEGQCIGCGKAFDLSYDLDVKREVEEYELAEIAVKVKRNSRNLLKHLCWKCREIC